MNWLNDFNARLAVAPLDEDADREYMVWSPNGTADEGSLAALEVVLGFGVPAALREFYLQHGAFATDGFDSVANAVKVFTPAEIAERGKGLAEAIDGQWGGRPEIAEYLSAESLARLNRRTAVWGMRRMDDNQHLYYYFDDAGGIGTLYYDQDNPDWSLEEMRDIARGEPHTLETLETLMAGEVEAALGA